jgi:hypothetical protein
MPTAQDAVVQAANRLWSALTQRRTRHWAHADKGSMKHASDGAPQQFIENKRLFLQLV